MMPSDELFDDYEPGPNLKAALEPLIQDCEEAIELQEQITLMEESLKALKSRHHFLRTRAIPDKMADAGVGDSFSTSSGYKIKLSQMVWGGLPKAGEAVLEDNDPRELAIAELCRIGGESLIKNKVMAEFDKGENEKAQSVAKMILDLGYQAEVEESVHTMAYRAFIKEVLNNSDLNPDLAKLGVEIVPQVKITPPKG